MLTKKNRFYNATMSLQTDCSTKFMVMPFFRNRCVFLETLISSPKKYQSPFVPLRQGGLFLPISWISNSKIA
jgi:hypothetical protein